MSFFKAVCASSIFCLSGAAALSNELDSVEVQMTGVVEDVCSVDGITSVSSQGFASFTNSAVGSGVDTANLGFDFAVMNDANPASSTIGMIDTGTIDVVIDLYCNGEFQLTIEGTNGALLNGDALINSADFTNSLPYSVAMAFPDGTNTPTETSSGSGGVILSDSAVPAQDGNATLSITVANPGSLRPISGLFEEALTVSFVQDGTAPASSFSP